MRAKDTRAALLLALSKERSPPCLFDQAPVCFCGDWAIQSLAGLGTVVARYCGGTLLVVEERSERHQLI